MAPHVEQPVDIEHDHFNALVDGAVVCQTGLQHQKELEYRLAIYRHPLRSSQHSALQVQNLALALRIVLAVDQDVFEDDRIALARELLHAVDLVPVNAVAPEAFNDHVPSWERCMRLLLRTIDLDVIFGPAVRPLPGLLTSFVSSAGAPMDISAVAARCSQLDAQVVFCASTSAEYFGLYAETYVSSILARCDCNCLIVICVCSPRARLANIISTLRIDDRRLIFCSDHFDPMLNDKTVIRPTGGEPLSGVGCYYACAALLRTDGLLRHLGLPIFVTGIDTVLQRGVVDLIEQFSGADLVFNKFGPQGLLGCQLVNSLVLIYPTRNGLLFAEFLKTYLGRNLIPPNQPAFLDQLDLHMAKHHVMASGVAPVVGYFNDFDINNLMFTRMNYRDHLDLMKSFRFLNMFVSPDDQDMRLTATDVRLEDT